MSRHTKLIVFPISICVVWSLFVVRFTSSYPSPVISSSNIKRPPVKAFKWPPMKVYVYPEHSRHTIDCMHPVDMPNRYTNESNFWFQRMLEPTVHKQLMKSPLFTHIPIEGSSFVIPHYSRMCSGLDRGLRWSEIPNYTSESTDSLMRYSSVDHFVMHSVPNYGDCPADIAVITPKAPQIGLYDIKWHNFLQSPWLICKNIVTPFITLKSAENLDRERNISVFVAMSTSTKGLAASSGLLRQRIETSLKRINGSLVHTIVRGDIKSFRSAIDTLSDMMASSTFCIVPPGDAPSSKRLYDAISNLCIPVLLADKFTLPYDGTYVDYEKVAVQIPAKDVDKIPEILESIPKYRIESMREGLKRVREMFTWNYKEEPKAGQALSVLSWALYDKHIYLSPYLNSELVGNEHDEEFQWVKNNI